MTSLYRLDAPASAIAATFGAEAGDDPWTGDYVAPARPAPIIVSDGRGGSRRYLRPKLWGVPPPPQGDRPVTTVRNLESPFWIGTLRFPNIYGIDMPSPDELIAHNRSETEIETLLGCDWLIYQDLPDLEAAVAGPKFPGRKFDSSCFNGDYVTGVEPGYFERIEHLRSDEAKKQRRVS